jgi:hypothetical protein
VSPEARASAAALARLLAEIAEDRVAMAARLDDAREATRRLDATPRDPGALALAAVALHGWYTGAEAVFERIARQLDGALPHGDRWHRELLSQMSAEIPGTRPPVIPAEVVRDLGALLAFRHFFRHGYGVTLDATHLQIELARLLAIHTDTDRALDLFRTFLEETAQKLAAG